MARINTNDRSASATPRFLIAIAAVLFAARLIDCAMSVRKVDASPLASAVHWQLLEHPAASGHARIARVQAPPEEQLPADSARSLARIFSESRIQGKIVLYEFYADWSDPCKSMESTALKNTQVGPLLESEFLPVRITDRQHEDGQNSVLVNHLLKKYRVFAFPTLIAIDQSGEPIATLVGNCSSLTTYRFLTRAASKATSSRRV